MEPAARPQRESDRSARLKRHIFQGKTDAEYFHEFAVKCLTEGHNDLAEKAFDAEKACRETVAALEIELKERC